MFFLKKKYIFIDFFTSSTLILRIRRKLYIIIFNIFFLFIFSHFNTFLFAQDSGFGSLNLDEYSRRKGLIDGDKGGTSFHLRFMDESPKKLFFEMDSIPFEKKGWSFEFLPVYTSFRLDGKRPYSMGEYGGIPARGYQSFLSLGIKASYSILHLQFQPEWVFAENRSFNGFPNSFSSNVISSRFLSWNVGDSPERFGNKSYNMFFLGQSSLSFRYKSFEIGVGTRNFWWGPGQWNSLVFSNNSPGFPSVSINTIRPAKTFLGHFEGQVLIGRLESSNLEATQDDVLNSKYFTSLNSDWRYLNGIMISFSPKWIQGLSIGYARTYQYYNGERPKDIKGWLPILEPMAKEKLFVNGNSLIYDNRIQSQQISIFGRYRMSKAKAEVYFQFGRRDHALNWREFILNPEHARAYQVGFLKISSLPSIKKLLQIRGEITHQQESVNRYIRYDLNGGLSWHTHGRLRGFTNYGQAMGVGISTGSNVQTLEVSLVEDWNKWGVLFERLENNQDFHYRAFGQQDERKPWIDWSTAVLWNTSYKSFFISARLQGTFARNYQWGLSKMSTPEFPVSQNLFSVHSQVNLIYFWDRNFGKK